MAAAPKGVAGRRNSLPAQQAAADPLQTYCPDLDQWPRSWAYEACDIPPGLRLVEYFKPFLRNLLALQLSRQTLRRHRDNIWALGGELIRALQMDSDLRRRPIEQVVLSLIGDDGGPLLSHGQSETEQRAFDATCRKLSRFLADPMISRAAPLEALQQRRTDCAIDGTNANRPATRVAVKPRSRAAVRRRRRA
jgi:hypothetical protein